MSSALARYRCAIETEVSVTLENVTIEQRPMFFLASGNTMAWSAFALAGMAIGRQRVSSLEGKNVAVPAECLTTTLATS